MLIALRISLLGLGLAAILIASSIFFFGASFTAAVSESTFDHFAGGRWPLTGTWPPTMDSELRFYAALWGAYGVVLLRAANNLRARLAEIPCLASVFFAGGVGRILSQLSVGAPHPVFTLLLVVEIGLPIVIVGLWLGVRRQGAAIV